MANSRSERNRIRRERRAADPEQARAVRRDERARQTPEQRERERIQSAKWYAANIDVCRAKARERARIRRIEHADRVRAQKRAWAAGRTDEQRAAHAARRKQSYRLDPYQARQRVKQRRATKRGNVDGRPVTVWETDRARNRQRGLCYYCDVQKPLNQEHIVPISRGGRHAIGNVVLVCQPCNDSKGRLTAMEYKRREGLLGQIPPFRR